MGGFSGALVSAAGFFLSVVSGGGAENYLVDRLYQAEKVDKKVKENCMRRTINKIRDPKRSSFLKKGRDLLG